MTLQYGLSSAPASQPRNVILGQIVAGAVSLAFTHVPLGDLCQQAVGPAFAITAMVVLGIPHPPAGAHAVIYAGGGYGWMSYMLVILASILTVVPATMVNNLSEKRQYPTFWGYLPRWLSGQVTLINKKTVASNDGEKVPVKRGSDKGEKETAV
jgi:CBS-domain-containing membrane protein